MYLEFISHSVTISHTCLHSISQTTQYEYLIIQFFTHNCNFWSYGMCLFHNFSWLFSHNLTYFGMQLFYISQSNIISQICDLCYMQLYVLQCDFYFL